MSTHGIQRGIWEDDLPVDSPSSNSDASTVVWTPRAPSPFRPRLLFRSENDSVLSNVDDVPRGSGTENDPFLVDTPDTRATLDTTRTDESVMNEDDSLGDYGTMETVEDDLDLIIRSVLLAVDTLVDARRFAKGEFTNPTVQRYHVARAMRASVSDLEHCIRQVREIDDAVVGASNYGAWKHVYGDAEPVAESEKFNVY